VFAFTLRCALPSGDSTLMDLAPTTAPTESARPLHVLLAEDHPINQKLASLLLAKMGHTCVLAQDGEAALAQLAEQRFDLVLMDVMMPRMDGLTALARLREAEADAGRRTPVLMVTAHAMTGDRERFMAAGADGYVSKPISAALLAQEMARVMHTPST
jgi:CheY-like chemotaxis protein